MKRYIVETERGLDRMVEHISRHDRFGFDWEYHKDSWVNKPEIVSCNFAVREGNEYIGYYVPLAHELGLLDEYRNFPSTAQFLNRLKPLLESSRYTKVCHAAEVESGLAKQYGIELGDSIRCTQISAWLYDENKSWEGGLYPFRLKEITPKILGRKIDKLRDLEVDGDIAKLSIAEGAVYGTNDAIHTLMLDEWLEPELKAEGVWDTYLALELPMVRVFRDTVRTGIVIDLENCQLQRDTIVKQQDAIAKKVYAEAGGEFNIRSRQQLAAIMFDQKGYRLKDENGREVEPARTAPSKNFPSGQYKTSDDVMEQYANAGFPIATLMREHGDYEKLRGTYFQKFLDCCTATSNRRYGLYYPSLWQCGTTTGRAASDFQQVPRTDKDRTLDGQLISVRALVTCLPDEHLIVADFNQLELRLLAHFSEDPVLLACYNEGEDLHAGTAAAIIEAARAIRMNDFSLSRQDAKPVNFALVYGLSESSLIEMFGEELGRAVYKYLKTRFAGMEAYKTAFLHQAHLDGYIRTLAWRKRRVPEINSESWSIRSHAERQLFNSLMQGSAADIVKMAQLAVYRKFPELKMALQVHDELLGRFKGTKKQATELVREMKQVMERVVELNVPLICDPNVGRNWKNTKN